MAIVVSGRASGGALLIWGRLGDDFDEGAGARPGRRWATPGSGQPHSYECALLRPFEPRIRTNARFLRNGNNAFVQVRLSMPQQVARSYRCGVPGPAHAGQGAPRHLGAVSDRRHAVLTVEGRLRASRVGAEPSYELLTQPLRFNHVVHDQVGRQLVQVYVLPVLVLQPAAALGTLFFG